MVGEDLAVAHDHHEGLQRLPELLAYVVVDVEMGIGSEGGAEIGGDERRKAAR